MSTIGELFAVIDLAGVLTNAILGGIVARDERMDPIGFLTLALLSGLGGGIIRDTLLQHGPPVALTDFRYALCAVVGAAIAFLMPIGGRAWHAVFPYVDALALGFWATAGAQKTLALGLGWVPALLLGTITAVGGGTLRDLTVHRVPQIFRGTTLYATSALAASAVVIGFWYVGLAQVDAVVGTAAGAVLCLISRRRGWQLWSGLSWEYDFARKPGQKLPHVSVRMIKDDPPPADQR
ncbi:putative membrane protein YeiH [Mycobacterium sp. MAA66]|uniref:trimeric intracellular cation channel family protein n=1 Tax=Mycobacterium sp. MAA66 TaxID=3156297 RepID=UPI0035155C21